MNFNWIFFFKTLIFFTQIINLNFEEFWTHSEHVVKAPYKQYCGWLYKKERDNCQSFTNTTTHPCANYSTHMSYQYINGWYDLIGEFSYDIVICVICPVPTMSKNAAINFFLDFFYKNRNVVDSVVNYFKAVFCHGNWVKWSRNYWEKK